MQKFNDKVVVITGASSGIGAETAVRFAGLGAKIVITGRNRDGLNDTLNKCKAAGANQENILLVTGDVTREDDVNRIIDATVDKFSQINVLVNNAGSVIVGALSDLSGDDVIKSYMDNTVSVFYMTKKAMPYLLKTKGNVVNNSTMFGEKPFPAVLAYGMAKAALDNFTRSLAIEYGPKGVRVNAVTPCSVVTPIFGECGLCEDNMEAVEALLKSWAPLHPLKRPGRAIEVADAIVFLASDAATYTTGCLLPVDGGRFCCAQGAVPN